MKITDFLKEKIYLFLQYLDNFFVYKQYMQKLIYKKWKWQ